MRAGNPFGSCPTFDLTASLQWSGCPTRTCDPDMPDCDPDPNCLLAPDIVSNSWGGGQGSSSFWDVLGVLKEEEIIVTFSMGNSGSGAHCCPAPRSHSSSVCHILTAFHNIGSD